MLAAVLRKGTAVRPAALAQVLGSRSTSLAAPPSSSFGSAPGALAEACTAAEKSCAAHLAYSSDQHDSIFGAEAAGILAGLSDPRGASLPEVWYLYDDAGSALFEEITKQPEYYLTSTELGILDAHATDMARYPGEQLSTPRAFPSVLVELGAGSGKKMRPIFDAEECMSRADGQHDGRGDHVTTRVTTTYVAADYSTSALEENATVYNSFNTTRPHFMKMRSFVGTNDDAIERMSELEGRKTFVYLGSSLGNDVDPVPFMHHLISHCTATDRVIIGVDLAADADAAEGGKKTVEVINKAYNDAAGVTSEFILNSLSVVNRVAGTDFDTRKFKHVAEYNKDNDAVEIFAECICPCDVTATAPDKSGKRGAAHEADDALDRVCHVRSFDPGDRIFIEQSGKFSRTRLGTLASEAGMIVTRSWEDDNGYYRLFEAVPNVAEKRTELSNFFFKDIIGTESLAEQPIDLRNPYAFYWGHISAFSDRVALMLPGRAPERHRFERGVDPDVDDPSKIHAHSDRVQRWPEVAEFEAYAAEVEDGLAELVAREGPTESYLMAIEHADMHHETLMYNLSGCARLSRVSLEERRQAAEPDDTTPRRHPFSAFAPPSNQEPRTVPRDVFVDIPSHDVSLGCNEQTLAAVGFVWDNELPSQPSTSVPSFRLGATPVTNREFAEFVEDGGYKNAEYWISNPVSNAVVQEGGNDAWTWLSRAGMSAPRLWDPIHEANTLGTASASATWGVRTACDGVVPMTLAGGAKDGVANAADWPAWVTLFEAAAFCEWRGSGARIMSEPEYHAVFGDDQASFNAAARSGNNNWKHRTPVPVGTMGDGHSTNGVFDMVGNGWEWTASEFAPLDGFAPMESYPEYSADFFDGKHFVIKGASPFTSARLQRLSFRNFFQPNYPYVFAKFRVAYDK